jgi:cytochrome c oxidase assembly protein subunit 15
VVLSWLLVSSTTAIPLAPTRVPTVTRRIFQLATLLTFLAVALGSIVCATESGFECGNWPGCTASALLPSGPVTSFFYKNPWIEMTHRTSAILVGPAALAAAVLALRLKGAHPLVKVLPWVTVAGALVAGYFGRLTVLGLPIPAWGGALDLGSALAAMAAMVVATVALERTPTRLSPSRTGGLAWISVTLMVAMHLVSLFAAGVGSYTRCLSWPVWELLAADRSASGSAQVIRIGLAIVAACAVLATIWYARNQAALRGPAVGTGVLLAVVVLFGLVIRVTHSDQLGVPFSVATVALVWTEVLLAARASLTTSNNNTPQS